ncbi:MAG: ATP phosphoribosyltransferase regulatory subunit [Eubacteriales bacterium]
MNQKNVHTPEGVRDIYPLECRQKLVLQSELHKTIRGYGYQDIQTPTLEFSEVFSKELGSVEAKELYRFFDRDGNILVLRPDITPSIARALTTVLESADAFGKYCYTGNTFINHTSYQGRLKENTQLGAEMIGIDSVEADAEMLAMVADLLKTVELDEFQISLSHVAFMNSLLEEAALDTETEETIREFCENKNYFGMEEVLVKCELDEALLEAFHVLPELVGGVEVLEKAKKVAPNASALEAISRLEAIVEVLDMYGVLNYVSFDLSMTGTYGYYTGIIFRAYTFGIGDAVVKGGRYDQLLSKFGKDFPAIGFAITVDELFNALTRQKVDVKYELDNHILLFDAGMQHKAIRLAKSFRKNGRVTEIVKKDEIFKMDYYTEYGRKNFGKYMLYLKENNTVLAVNLLDGSMQEVDMGTSV